MVISMCSCTTIRTVAPRDLEAAFDSLQIGAHIDVNIAAAWRENLAVVGVTDSSILAENADGERLTLARSEIAGLRIQSRAPGKTAGIAAGIFFGVLGSGIPGLSL
jgi:hypothetical protein